jgi:hypothetical protein
MRDAGGEQRDMPLMRPGSRKPTWSSTEKSARASIVLLICTRMIGIRACRVKAPITDG